ncbi:GyrI-like domain-containing protein [Exiguobacterium flavidum]|uniref:GyrI-like domain-containing protein n=1 Tax=Exiguobacterium flavidum TaxID=2184695 RepID=UPI000DF76D36|nr:GyrI-like domain-containing protein [Exiguobacterium flavidum]
MEPEIVERESFNTIGLTLTCEENELHFLMPELWREFSRRSGEIPALPEARPMDIALSRRGTTYTQCVGLPVASLDSVPKGMKGHEVPEGRYLFVKHAGPETDIWKTFANMQQFAEREGLALDPVDFKIDETHDDGHHLYQRLS